MRKLVPGYGFCERSEILTGAGAATTANFAAYTYAPALSPFRRLSHIQPFLSGLDSLANLGINALPNRQKAFGDKILGRARKELQRLYRRFAPCYDWNRIPLQFFPLFALTEDATDHSQSQAFVVPSVYDELQAKGGSWFHGFQDLASDLKDPYDISIQKLCESFVEPHQFYTFALGHLDTHCHMHGTGRDVRRPVLMQIDDLARKLHNTFINANPDAYVLLFGDHGMLDVTRTFDAEKSIKQFTRSKGWKIPRDLVYFLDSTMVRFWGKKATECLALLSRPEWTSHGRLVDDSLANEIGITKAPYNYGEVIWWAHDGVCVFPDFFRRVRAPKGMHGYDVRLDGHKGCAFLSGVDIIPQVREEGHLIDIAPTVETLLELDIPNNITGRSWI